MTILNKKGWWDFAIVIAFLVQTGCVNNTNKQQPPTAPRAIRDTVQKPEAVNDSSKMASPDTNKTVINDTVNKQSVAAETKYHLMAVTKRRLDSLLTDSNKLDIVLALNRVDEKHLKRMKSLIVPDIFVMDLKYYSPFPDSVSSIQDVPKMIFFSYASEAFAAYENGILVRWGPVSMGKRTTPTPTGLYHTNWKSPEKRSTVKEEWIMKWYFNLDDKEGVSMHQYDLPGYPASHACVRLLETDAIWFYHWAEQNEVAHKKVVAKGTPVIIFGEYAFGHQRPWPALAKDNKATDISAEKLNEEADEYMPRTTASKK